MPMFKRERNARLRREYLELLASPVPNCSAQPLEDDIREWHANIYVPALRRTFHFIIKYPAGYPEEAPKVRNCTYIEHPNVFGDYICLDILTMSKEMANTPYRGWTSAYTISSLLIQLQSFLFSAFDPTKQPRSGNRMELEAHKFVCKICNHCEKTPVPEIPCLDDDTCTIIPTTTNATTQSSFLDDCHDQLLTTLLEFVDIETLGKICVLLEDVTHAVDLVFARRTYKCFYTLKNLNDTRAVFGLGAKKFVMPRRSRKTRERTNQLQQLHCSFDYISHEAYGMGVRNNIWKDRDFDSFIPLYINHTHGKKALPLAEKCILEIWNESNLARHHRSINEELILNTLSKLMNTTVVNMMKTVEDLEAGELQLFDSIKALSGYTSMHHLLLAFCEKYPAIRELANHRVQTFITNPVLRDKETCPDIGELLIDLAISDYVWDDFSPAWIEEVFIRNARWILAKYPNLFQFERAPSCIRLTQSHDATRTGQRLAMFQRFFISEVASPERLKGNPDKNSILLKEYNERLGMPARGIAERLQEHSRKVIACNNWWDYFELVNFCCPSAAHLTAWLRRSIEVSEVKQYHSKNQIMRYPENFIKKPNDETHLNCQHCLCSGDLYKIPTASDRQQCDVRKIKLVKKQKRGVDICFVMDCTGSMTSILETAKRHIISVVKKTSQHFRGEKVRFAIVGYRDHDSMGYGNDSYVLKKFQFTENRTKMQNNVEQFHTGGGGGPEAMCCAMAAAANMAWDRNSRQICILIGDQPPHGYTQSSTYDNGCPCGEDTLRVVHTMTKNGIVVYPVDCGYKNGDRQTFYHALARISGGYAFDIADAHLLPEIVVGACQQEGMIEKLTKVIKPMYLECIQSHAIGRFEQHCRAVYSECAAKKIKVESSLPDDAYEKHIEHQVDCIAFCTDIKHAKIMAKREYFFPINRKTKLCSYMERPVSLSQVTTCMKRMEKEIKKAKFLKTGCSYLSHRRFSRNAFQVRWQEFNLTRNIANFNPWNSLDRAKVQMYSRIPTPNQMKRRKKEKKCRAITQNQVGRIVEVEIYGVWTKVRIIRFLQNFKIAVEFGGVTFEIDDAPKWRQATATASWNTSRDKRLEASPRLLRELNLDVAQTNVTTQPPAARPQNSSTTGPSQNSTMQRKPVANNARRPPVQNNQHPNSMQRKPVANSMRGVPNVVQRLIVQNNSPSHPASNVSAMQRNSAARQNAAPRPPVTNNTPAHPPSNVSTMQRNPAPNNFRNPSAAPRPPVQNSIPSNRTTTQRNPVNVVQNTTSAPTPAPLNTTPEKRTVENVARNTSTQMQAPTALAPAVPTLHFLHVPQSALAKDIAQLCMQNGVTPNYIKKVRTHHGIMAIIQFFSHEDAEAIQRLRRVTLSGTHMPIHWAPQYTATLQKQI